MSDDTANPASAFERAIALAGGSYTAVAKRFGLGSGFGVSKWRDGVPAERVIDLCRFAAFQVTPHELRPDLYPHPDDGLPPGMRVFSTLDEFSEVLTSEERDRIADAIAAKRPDEAIRMIEGLDVAVSVRAALLAAAQRAQPQSEEGRTT